MADPREEAAPAEHAEHARAWAHDIPCAHAPWHPGLPYEPDDEAMAASRDEKMIVDGMRHWFLTHYCDPAVETPYVSAEGGYIWLWGGPYDPGEELRARFHEIADDAMIDRLANELRLEGGTQWAPIRHLDGYDERFEIKVENPDAPLVRLKERLGKVAKVLELEGDQEAMGLIPSLVFGSVISALEAYLSETVTYWVENDALVVRALVTRLPAIKAQPMMLGQIFEKYDGLETTVKAHLQHLVWHRWEDVAQLFIYGFGFRPPSFRPFENALLKRHDIVHRSGHDKEGNPVSIAAGDVMELAASVEEFAEQIHAKAVERSLKDAAEQAP